MPSSALSASPSAVQTTLFLHDELGSAVAQASSDQRSVNINAVMAPLVCVKTLGGVAFSLLWLTKDVKEGEVGCSVIALTNRG